MSIKRILLKDLIENAKTYSKCYTDVGKWEKHVIACIVRNESSEITYLGLFDDNFNTLSNARLMKKEEVIELVNETDSVITTFHVKSDCWKKGDEVHVVSDAYLRTDGNEKEEDNLGELIEFTEKEFGL